MLHTYSYVSPTPCFLSSKQLREEIERFLQFVKELVVPTMPIFTRDIT